MSRIRKIGVVGAGNMGAGIAQKIAQEGLRVVLVDIKPEYVQRGLDSIRALLDEGVQRRIFKPAQVEQTLGRIQGTTDVADLADADLVIEAVFEDFDVKAGLFQQLDAACGPRTILATNTSSFYVRDFAARTQRPDRFIGLHYFFHPAKNRLLEIIPHEGTSPDTVEACQLAARLHGKTAIVVKDAAGFAVNRFFVPFLNEAARMLEEGVADIPTIEEGARRAFRIGMGPFLLMNVTGIPIAVHSSATLGRELGPFYATAAILERQMEKHEDWDLSGEVEEEKVQAVHDRFQGVCLGVAAQLVSEGVARIEDTDRGAKIGLRWVMGPFELMNRLGIEETCELVQAIAHRYEDFAMPSLLLEQRQKGEPFAFRVVDLDVADGIATLTLNRPEAMNALNEAVVGQLAAAFAAAEADPEVRAIVLRGAGKAFVAGADIRYFVKKIKADAIDDIVTFTRAGHELLLAIESSPKLTIAVLDGLSLGGGSELALACQAIVATPAGSLGFPETGIGIFPGLGGMPRLARQVGSDLAAYYVLTGRSISATAAHDLGLVAALVPAGELDGAIRALVDVGAPAKNRARVIPESFQALAATCAGDNLPRLLAGDPIQHTDAALAAKTSKIVGFKAPIACRVACELIHAGGELSMEQAAELELGRLTEIFSTADALEGLSAVGRRRPSFTGT